MAEPLRIVILGGGTAGWICANLMARRWLDKAVTIKVLESPDIGIIGVGEGSTPTLKRFFSEMNIADSDWMPACKATYKVNIRFEGWSPASGVQSYGHPFIGQVDVHSERAFMLNCYTRRLGLDVQTQPELFFLNGWLAREQRLPLGTANFPFRVEYGYHFDSGLLGEFLRKHALTLGVAHQACKVTQVRQHPDGSIQSLQTEQGETIDGELFVDCSGFQALLMEQTLKVPFQSFADNLFNDAAVVIPTAAQEQPEVETRATALSHGWAWQIPLSHRTGNGYVYSSAFIDKHQAEQQLREHLQLGEQDVSVRHLNMRVGQRQYHWYKNCLTLGLAQGFIEPLEATALHLVQIAAEIFIDHYEQGNFSQQLQATYNQQISTRFERVRDYIVAHYKLNSRDDSDYWRANRDNQKLSDSLIQLLNVWYRKQDLAQEIARQELASHFNSMSWHCLLAGYGAFPALASNQPGKGDLYKEQQLAQFFRGCLLNFTQSSQSGN